MNLPDQHHVWCNGLRSSPVKGCRWCDGENGLWAKYPYTDEAEAIGGALMEKHFPENIRRT